MLGERMAPCWCYSPIHFEWRRKRFQGHALLQGRGECKMKKYIYIVATTGVDAVFRSCGGFWKLGLSVDKRGFCYCFVVRIKLG